MSDGKTKMKKGINKRALALYSMALIPMLFVFVFSYLPMAGLLIAFKNFRYDLGIWGSKWVGLKNFKFFFESNDFWIITRNTLGMNFLFIVIGIACAVLIAVLFYELKSRTATKVFQTVFITPHFLSFVVISYMVYAILAPQTGVLNNILKTFGIPEVSWYTTPKAWPIILTIVNVWKHVGMDCVIYYAALMGIDASLYEAAEIDGANKWQIIKKIMVPSIVPIISVMTILKIGKIFRADFGLFYLVTRDSGSLYSVTDVIDTYVYRTMQVTGDMSLSTAIGFLQSLVGMLLVIVTNYFSKKVDENNALF